MLVGWLVIPVQLVTTFVLGILVSVTFGLLLFPMSLIWIVCFLGPLLGLSWVWEKAPFLRIPIAVVGIPLAFVGNIYACLMPPWVNLTAGSANCFFLNRGLFPSIVGD